MSGTDPRWLVYARRIQALAQTGLAFSADPYDRERYTALQRLAAEMMAEGGFGDPDQVEWLFAAQTGYATPKVEVRAAVFDPQGRVLMVREASDAGRWTLPGGWADVHHSPSECVIKEVREEAGVEVAVRKLACVFDRALHPHPRRFPFHVYKLFFLCDPVSDVGLARGDGLETTEAACFHQDALPLDDLSTARVLPFQLARLFAHHRDPALPTEFD